MEACQLEGVHRGSEDRCGPRCLEQYVLWTPAPESASPNTVVIRVPSLQLRSSQFSGRHRYIQRIMCHCGKGNGRGFAAGALGVERRVTYHFLLHPT